MKSKIYLHALYICKRDSQRLLRTWYPQNVILRVKNECQFKKEISYYILDADDGDAADNDDGDYDDDDDDKNHRDNTSNNDDYANDDYDSDDKLYHRDYNHNVNIYDKSNNHYDGDKSEQCRRDVPSLYNIWSFTRIPFMFEWDA